VIFAQVPLGAPPSNKVGVAIVTATGQTLQRGLSFRSDAWTVMGDARAYQQVVRNDLW